MFSMRTFLRIYHMQTTHQPWTDQPDQLLQHCDAVAQDPEFQRILRCQTQQLSTTVATCGRPECREQFLATPSQHAALRAGKRVYHHPSCKAVMSGRSGRLPRQGRVDGA